MPARKKTKAVSRKKKTLDRDAMKKRETAIIADLKGGQLSYRVIAQKHGVSLPTVNAKARKAGIRRPRGRRPLHPRPEGATAARRPGRPRKAAAAASTTARRAGRPARNGSARAAFEDAFREMVLRFFPTLTLARYDRLVKMVSDAVR